MSNDSTFFYEHMGHMQFSILTLRTFEILKLFTDCKEGIFIPWEQARKEIEQYGFSKRQAEGELDRFCYGFECIDRYNDQEEHEISLSRTGIGFLNNLISESLDQPCQIAFLVREAKRKNFWNITIQESTFFNQQVYELISNFKFRPGGAREFLRCIPINELIQFLTLVIDALSPVSIGSTPSLENCIKLVQDHGKYWASVGSRYSWFVFSQKFQLPFSSEDWKYYDSLIADLVRPPEWGGGYNISSTKLTELFKNKDRIKRFREFGIIRPIWDKKNIQNASFRLTSPGYLMWERKKKGFLFEFRIRKLSQKLLELRLCDAYDIPSNSLKYLNRQADSSCLLNLGLSDTKGNIVNTISQILNTERTLPLFKQNISSVGEE